MKLTVYEIVDYVLENFVNIQLGVDAVLFCIVLFLTIKYFAYRKMVNKVVAEHKNIPPSDARLKAWKDTLSGLPQGSPKRGAYIAAIRDAEDGLEAQRKTDKNKATERAEVEERFECLEKCLQDLIDERDKLKDELDGSR